VLKLDELLGYIGYAKATYSAPEVKKIADTLLRINNRVVHGLQ
jgi:cob(I)alamin adenosyltransferase